MPGANHPSGPGTSLHQQRAVVAEREELDEMFNADNEANNQAADQASGESAARAARHAERDAHTPNLPTGRGRGRSGSTQSEAAAVARTTEPADAVAKQWVLVADDAIARVMRRTESGATLEEVRTFTDPLAHAREADMHRDSHGRRGDDRRMGGNATASAADAQKHIEAARFAQEVADWLGEAEREGNFDELTVVAAPRFLGQLRKALSPQVTQHVVAELPKDVVHESMLELTQRLFKPRDQLA